jgi:hypothetical protein
MALQVVATLECKPGRKLNLTANAVEAVMEEALEALAHGHTDDITKRISKRTGVPQGVIPVVLAGLAAQSRTELAMFRAIVSNASSQAAEAGLAIWEEVA